MSEILLFGACEMTPARFAAMAPHVKTEALRLMAERGYQAGDVATATGLAGVDLMGIYGARHQFSFRSGEREAAPQAGERRLGLSGAARLILLQMQDQAGTLAASGQSIGYDIGRSVASVQAALKLLLSRELIELTAPAAGRNHPAQYRMTKAGHQMAERLAALPQEGDADA